MKQVLLELARILGLGILAGVVIFAAYLLIAIVRAW